MIWNSTSWGTVYKCSNLAAESNLSSAMDEFDRSGKCSILADILEKAAQAQSQIERHEYQLLFNVIHKFSDISQGEKAEERAKKFLVYLLEGFGRDPHVTENSDTLGSDSSRKSSMEAERDKAEAEAKRITTEAQKSCREAQEKVQSAQESARVQADGSFEEALVPSAVRKLLDGYHEDDDKAYNEFEVERKKLIQDLEQRHVELCDRVKELQADINDTLSDAQNRLCTELTKWREAFYEKEVSELADCYMNLHRMQSGLEKEFGNAVAACTPPEKADCSSMPSSGTSGADDAGSTYPTAEQDQLGLQSAPAAARPEEAAAQQLVEQLQKYLMNLNRFAKQLRNAMRGVGLDVYIPVEGDRFDPALHTLKEDNEDNYELEGREIARCSLPGVRMLQPGGSAKDFESPRRAEVELK